MSYGILVQRLKKEEERAARPARPQLVKATPIRAGQTPTDIVLAALHDLPRRLPHPRRRVACGAAQGRHRPSSRTGRTSGGVPGAQC